MTGLVRRKAQPWRTGANETTTITFSHDVKVEGKDLPAGTYGVFLAFDKTGPLDLDFFEQFRRLGRLSV